MVAGHRSLLLLLAATAVLTVFATVATTEDAKPTILTPVAQTPVGSFEGDKPGSDDAMDNEDAAPVGSPIGTTMTEPKPEGSTEGGAAAEGATPTASTASSLVAMASCGVATMVAAAGVFPF